MNRRRLGKSDLEVSAIGLVTGQFGTPAWGYGTRYDGSTIIDVVHPAIDNRISISDTADTHANGLLGHLLEKVLDGYERNEYVRVLDRGGLRKRTRPLRCHVVDRLAFTLR